ncbi:MAG: ATP-binding protein [Desulfovibrionales bacterium]
MSQTDPVLGLKLPATEGSVAQFQEHAVSQASSLDPGTRQKVELVLEEVLINVISYAYPPECPGWIELLCLHEPARFSVIITDSGKPFDPLETEPPDLSLDVEEREIGGLGIHLVRQMTDHAEYARKDEKNVITLGWELGLP